MNEKERRLKKINDCLDYLINNQNKPLLNCNNNCKRDIKINKREPFQHYLKGKTVPYEIYCNTRNEICFEINFCYHKEDKED